MTRKDYKELIEYRIHVINETLGTNYQATYLTQYGGWELYEKIKLGAHARGYLGFDSIKSSSEMLAYLEGIFNLLTFYKVESK